jgi:hypothetical protein
MPPPIVALRQSCLALVTPLIPLSPYWHPAARCALSSGQYDGQVISCCLGLIRGYAELVAAVPGNEQERLALMEAHRADVTVNLAEIHENLKLIDDHIAPTAAAAAGACVEVVPALPPID